MNIDRDTFALPVIRFGFVVSGILAIYLAINNFLPNLTAMSMVTLLDSKSEAWSFLISTTIAPAILTILAFVLIRYSDNLARRLVPDAVVGMPEFESSLYRVVFTGCGVLVLSWALPRIAQVLSNIFMMHGDSVPNNMHRQLTESNWISIIYFCLQSAIGLYLIVGAPHLVKWQVNRSRRGKQAG